MTIKKHLEHFLAYRAYRRGWEAGYRRGLEDGSVALPTKPAPDKSWIQTEKSTTRKAK